MKKAEQWVEGRAGWVYTLRPAYAMSTVRAPRHTASIAKMPGLVVCSSACMCGAHWHASAQPGKLQSRAFGTPTTACGWDIIKQLVIKQIAKE